MFPLTKELKPNRKNRIKPYIVKRIHLFTDIMFFNDKYFKDMSVELRSDSQYFLCIVIFSPPPEVFGRATKEDSFFGVCVYIVHKIR